MASSMRASGGRRGCAWLATALLIALPTGALAQEWSQWRGRDRDGVVHDFVAPETWPEELHRRWKVEVGTGHSTPLVVDDRIYLHTRDVEADAEVVRALQLSDGQVIWEDTYAAPYRMHPAGRAFGKGPVSTPVVADGRLFTLGKGGAVSCYDLASGERVWQEDFGGQFAAKFPLYGAGMSPILDGGRLIVQVGGPDDGALMALDPATGEIIWSLEGDGPSYVSPIVVELEGQRQVVTQTDAHIISVAVDSGRLLWRIPFRTEFDQNVVTPALHGDKLILSGLNQPLFAIRLTRDGDAWTTQELWSNPSTSLYMSTTVSIGDRLFGMTHRRKGQFFAMSAETGETIWTSEGREGDNASFLVLDGLLVVLTDSAELILLRPDADEFAPLRRYTVADSQTWAHPVATRDGFLIKDLSSLALWGFEGS